MSLLKILAMFLVGFQRGFVEEYTGEKSARRLPNRRRGGERSFGEEDSKRSAYAVPRPPRGYDFREHMAGLSHATGIPLRGADSESAMFSSVFRGDTFYTTLMLEEESIIFGTMSNLSFRSGVPEDVHEFMREMNKDTLESCRYEVTKVKGQPRCCAMTQVPLSDLTPGVFQDLVADMRAAIWVLDDMLAKKGYAR